MLEPKLVYRAFRNIPHSFRRAMLREYLQYKTLQYIFNCRESAGLVFMGGTSLRLFYGNSRFSEDLDFDSGNLSREDLKTIAETAAKEFGREGVSCTLSSGRGESFSAVFRFTGILQKWKLTGHRNELIKLKFDATPQNFNYRPEVQILNRLDIITTVPAAPAELILAQKLYAILNRNRIMGRDLYDASYLLGFTEPDMEYLEEKLRLKTKRQIEEQITHRLIERSIEELTRDVEPFIPHSKDLMRIRLFPEILHNWAYRGYEPGRFTTDRN